MTDLAHLQALADDCTLTEWHADGFRLFITDHDGGHWAAQTALLADAAWIAATCPAKLLPMLERMEAKHSKIQEAFDTQCEDLQHICEERDCPAGEKRTEWLDTYITTLEAENKALREALADPTGEMWLAGRKVIDAEFDKAEAAQSYEMRSAILDRIPEKVLAAMTAARAALTPATGA